MTLALLATVASASGLAAGLARGTTRTVPARDTGSGAADRTPHRVPAPATMAGSAAPAAGPVAPDVARRDGAPSAADARHGAPSAAGLPSARAARVPAAASQEPRRTHAQRLVSAQLDAMVARAREQAPDDADEAVVADAAADGVSEEVRLQTAERVLAGMLEGFAGGPARAEGSRDAATDRP